MQNLALAVCMFVCTGSLYAQQKQLTMQDAFLNVRTQLAPQTLRQLKWLKGTPDALSFIDKRNGNDVLIRKSALSGKESEILNFSQFSAAVSTADPSVRIIGFPTIEWESADSFWFLAGGKKMRYDLKTGTVKLISKRQLPAEAANIDVDEASGNIAFTIGNNLYYSNGETHKAITSESNPEIVNGQGAHRFEFGITKGTFWSPSGQAIAYYRMDQTMVTDYPVIDWTSYPAKNVNIKYPMAGGKSHEVTVGVYHIASGKTVFLNTGEPKEQYLTNIAWSPDEKKIYLAVVNRAQNHTKLNVYNAETGAFEKTLFEETDEKYTEPQHPVLFVKNKPEWFIWQSQRDGYNHLYLYDTTGKLIRQLTRGEWVVTDVAGFDQKGQTLFFHSTIGSPISRDLCSVTLNNGKITRITSGAGTHTCSVNEQGTLVLDHYTSTSVPRSWSVYNTAGKQIRSLFTAENPLRDYALGEMTIFTLKSKGGFDLYCRLYKPVNFDSTKKYPVIVYQYGGPHAQLIRDTWNGGTNDLWFQYLAQRGYVVFTVDTRGSANRGRAFEQATFRNLGEAEMEDQLTGVAYLKSLPYVDASRMGLMGWSFGGFMTTSIMLKHPDVFKVAVAGGPVIDWSYYEIMYTERYMDTPQENPEGYRRSKLTEYVDNLKGRLMLIHGAQDDVVVWQHSIMMLKAAVDKGKLIDYMVYPGHEHNVIGKDRVHLFNTITRYFEDHL